MSWFRSLGEHLIHDTDGKWQAQAACAGRWDLFTETRFDYEGHYGELKAAQKICDSCPVKEICREAGTFEAAGVWGGRQRSIQSSMRELKSVREARHASA